MPATRVTIAIDVDGVVSPFVDPRNPLRHEHETGWVFRELPRRVMSKALVAEPIAQALLQLSSPRAGDEPIATVLWHTSWWLNAPEELAPALGLPGMTGGLERMFATEDEYLGRVKETWADSRWWKLRAVERWLDEHQVDDTGEHELLIWIDDDIAYAIEKGEIGEDLQRDPRLVMISPDTHIGIEPGELALLRALTGLE